MITHVQGRGVGNHPFRFHVWGMSTYPWTVSLPWIHPPFRHTHIPDIPTRWTYPLRDLVPETTNPRPPNSSVQIDTCENTTFLQLRLLAVNMKMCLWKCWIHENPNLCLFNSTVKLCCDLFGMLHGFVIYVQTVPVEARTSSWSWRSIQKT